MGSKGTAKKAGNFLELLTLLSKYDLTLDNHLRYEKRNQRYLSHDVQNDLIQSLASEISFTINKEVKLAQFFSLIIDSTIDISKIDQMSVSLRMVLKSGDVVERFTGFYTLKTATLNDHRSNVNSIKTINSFKNLCQIYCNDVNTEEAIVEYENFKDVYASISPSLTTDLQMKDVLQFLIEKQMAPGLPNLSILYKIYLTLPVTSANAERSFSKLKMIKNYLRSTMTNERLSRLALISIERELAEIIEFNFSINRFAFMKSRRKKVVKVPSKWKKSTIISVPKLMSPKLLKDLRPINMLPTYEKILEIAVHKQLSSYFESNNIFYNNQIGFRKNRSTESAIQLLLSKWRTSLNNNKFVVTVMLDLKRAFETVNRKILIQKLLGCKVKGTILNWIADYLSMRTQVVKIKGEESGELVCDIGVPQGSYSYYCKYPLNVKQLVSEYI
nr:uncharacterized protein LOC124806907 [Hydra vulgaris]